MRIKDKKLVWNIMLQDFNSNKIKATNIFPQSFIEELYKEVAKKKSIKTKQDLVEYVDFWAKHKYLSRAEFEICIGGLFSKYPEEFEKIDAYFQIKMNLNHIVAYIIDELQIKNLED